MCPICGHVQAIQARSRIYDAATPRGRASGLHDSEGSLSSDKLAATRVSAINRGRVGKIHIILS